MKFSDLQAGDHFLYDYGRHEEPTRLLSRVEYDESSEKLYIQDLIFIHGIEDADLDYFWLDIASTDYDAFKFVELLYRAPDPLEVIKSERPELFL